MQKVKTVSDKKHKKHTKKNKKIYIDNKQSTKKMHFFWIRKKIPRFPRTVSLKLLIAQKKMYL